MVYIDPDQRPGWEEQQLKLSKERKAEEKRLDDARRRKKFQAAERRSLLAQRRLKRNSIPESYLAPANLKSLDELASSEQAYAEGSSVEGDADKPTSIIVDLAEFNLRGSRFSNLTFRKGSSLNGADLTSAVFNDVVFESGVDLRDADFSNVEFNRVSFDYGSLIDGASFRFSRFGDGVSIEFDRNLLVNATFRGARKDKWAKLSSSFAGIWQYVNLTLSGAYFGILLLKLYIFDAIGVVAPTLINTLPSSIKDGPTSDISVWRFVLGGEWTTVIIAIGILIYQGLRLFATTRIGPLIEDERRSGYTPLRTQYIAYNTLYKVIRVLGNLVLIVFAFEIWQLIDQENIRIPQIRRLDL